MKKIIEDNIKQFSILMLLGILLSVLLKNANLWDLANYHYYNAFAFLNDRTESDVVPASINTFFNPIIDLPFYFLIQYFNDYPNILYAFQGIWSGLFLFMLYKISTLFFEQNISGYFKIILVLLLALTAHATNIQLGSYSNEISVTFFILWGSYILLKMIKFSETQTLKKFLIAGLIMGIGLGLKQTVVTYCVASGIMLMICHKYLNKPVKSIFCFALGGLIGYLIINGYFMYKYWILYQNPFFPFLNGIFKSPYFFDFNYRDARFVPPFKIALITPLLWNLQLWRCDDLYYYDLRLTIFYIMPIVGTFILATKNKLLHFLHEEKILVSCHIFCFLSLLIWLFLFSYIRYTCFIEAIGCLLLVQLLTDYDWNKYKTLFLIHTSCIIILILTPLLYEKSPSPHKIKVIDLQKLELPKNTLVKIYGYPTAFVIPELAKQTDIKTVTYYKKCTHSGYCTFDDGFDLAEYGPFLEKRNRIEKEHIGPIIYIYAKNIYKMKLNEDHITSSYNTLKKIYERASVLGFIKDKNTFLTLLKNDYEDNLHIAKQHISEKYYCSKLKNNLNEYLRICVPKELKTQILGEDLIDD